MSTQDFIDHSAEIGSHSPLKLVKFEYQTRESCSSLNEPTFLIKVMLHNTETCQGRISVYWICVVAAMLS